MGPPESGISGLEKKEYRKDFNQLLHIGQPICIIYLDLLLWKITSGAESGISGLEKTAPPGELEFSSSSN